MDCEGSEAQPNRSSVHGDRGDGILSLGRESAVPTIVWSRRGITAAFVLLGPFAEQRHNLIEGQEDFARENCGFLQRAVNVAKSGGAFLWVRNPGHCT